MFSNKTLVCMNLDTTPSVFLSMYRSDTTNCTMYIVHTSNYVTLIQDIVDTLSLL